MTSTMDQAFIDSILNANAFDPNNANTWPLDFSPRFSAPSPWGTPSPVDQQQLNLADMTDDQIMDVLNSFMDPLPMDSNGNSQLPAPPSPAVVNITHPTPSVTKIKAHDFRITKKKHYQITYRAYYDDGTYKTSVPHSKVSPPVLDTYWTKARLNKSSILKMTIYPGIHISKDLLKKMKKSS